jgi:hypothetical protein
MTQIKPLKKGDVIRVEHDSLKKIPVGTVGLVEEVLVRNSDKNVGGWLVRVNYFTLDHTDYDDDDLELIFAHDWTTHAKYPDRVELLEDGDV